MQGWKAELAAKERSNRGINNLGKKQAKQKIQTNHPKTRFRSTTRGRKKTQKKHTITNTGTLKSWKRQAHNTLQNSGTLHLTLERNPSRKSTLRIYNKKHPLNNLGSTKLVKCSTVECGGHEKTSWSFLLDAQKRPISSNTWALLLLSRKLRIKSIHTSGQWFVQASICKFSTNK